MVITSVTYNMYAASKILLLKFLLLYIKGAVMMTFAVRIMDIFIVVKPLKPGIFGM